MFLLDTNVLSEPTKSRPHAKALAWFAAHASGDGYVSVLSLGEIRYGVMAMPPGSNRDRLTLWVETQLPSDFQGRILDFDARAAHAWAALRAGAGRTLPPIDSLIAATALAHDLTLATRNTRDFDGLGLRLVDPFA